jgi:hypothetical protein
MTAFTSKRIGVTAAALLIAGALVGANAGAAQAYNFAPSLSVVSTSVSPGDQVNAQVNNAPDGGYSVTFNGKTESDTPQPNFEAPTSVGAFPLVLKVGTTVVDTVTITESAHLTAISVNRPSVHHNVAFVVSGHIAPAVGGVKVTVEGAGNNGVYKVLGTGTTNAAGAYAVTVKFTGTGSHFLRAVTTATAQVNSVQATTAKFTVQ